MQSKLFSRIERQILVIESVIIDKIIYRQGFPNSREVEYSFIIIATRVVVIQPV